MQIYVVGSAYETAVCLDRKCLINQITEVRIIIDCLRGKNGWHRQPLVKMYWDYEQWLIHYMDTLKYVWGGRHDLAQQSSLLAELVKPGWFCDWYFNVHKSRLYTKDKEHYKQWAYLGEAKSNWYLVNGIWKEYKQK